jgi:hypothetical protein
MHHLMPFETVPCRVCGERSVIVLPKSSVRGWQAGALIQSVFPWMSPDERELLISGTHSHCWDTLFGADLD